MAERIERLNAEDFDEMISFLGLAFGFEGPGDFSTMLPSIYRPTDEWMSCNYAIRRGGEIAAVVGVFPRTWRVGDARLRIAGVGGVSTRPEMRRQGLMKALMTRAVEDMRGAGYHLSWLGGQRQRYAYFGYERCGLSATYHLRKANARHAFREDPPALSFEPLNGSDEAQVRACKAMHEDRAVCCERPAGDWALHARAWGHAPYVVRDEGGAIVGSLVAANENAEVTEVDGRDAGTKMDVLRVWLARSEGGRLNVRVQPDEAAFGRTLGAVCESVNVGASGNWQVFDWQAVLDALMRVQDRKAGLPEGRVVVDIEGTRLALRVDGEGAECELTGDDPDFDTTALEAHRVLFGPTAPHAVTTVPKAAALLEAWCPLPVGYARPDGV